MSKKKNSTYNRRQVRVVRQNTRNVEELAKVMQPMRDGVRVVVKPAPEPSEVAEQGARILAQLKAEEDQRKEGLTRLICENSLVRYTASPAGAADASPDMPAPWHGIPYPTYEIPSVPELFKLLAGNPWDRPAEYVGQHRSVYVGQHRPPYTGRHRTAKAAWLD